MVNARRQNVGAGGDGKEMALMSMSVVRIESREANASEKPDIESTSYPTEYKPSTSSTKFERNIPCVAR